MSEVEIHVEQIETTHISVIPESVVTYQVDLEQFDDLVDQAQDAADSANASATEASNSAISAASSAATALAQTQLVDAKGDILIGTAPDTLVRKPVGSDGQALLADSTQTDGLKWTDLSATYILWSEFPEVNLARLGAKFDRRSALISTTASSAVVTSINAAFTQEDVGKVIFIPDAGPSGTPNYGTYIGNISSVQSETSATLTSTATSTATNAIGYLGTNNDASWQAAFDLIEGVGGGTIVLPEGHCIYATQKAPPNNIRIIGGGRDLTVIHPLGAISGFNRRSEVGEPNPDIITNTHFREFTIDGDMQTNGDGAGAKGFNLSYIVGGTFTDVIVRNTAGSGFGNDVQVDTHYTRCHAINCGRIGDKSSPGHSGFGFGSGAYATENVYLVDCIARDNMRHGLFFEDQPLAGVEGPLAAGVQVIGGRYEGNGVTGISDQSGRGMIILGAHIVNNGGQGFSVTTTAAIDLVGHDGVVSNCVITGNTEEGVDLAWIHTPLPSLGNYRILNNLVSNNGSHGIQVRAGNSFVVPGVEVRGNTCRDNYKNGIRVAGATFTRSRISDNMCVDNGQGSNGSGGGLTGPDRGGISIQTTLVDSLITDNYCTDSRVSGKSQAYGILINSSGVIGTVTGNSLISNNELRGNSTQALGGVGQVSGAAIVRGNTGMVGAISTITLTGSPMTRTCGVQNEEHFLSGGTISAVSVNGTALGAIAPISGLVLTPGDTLTVTYSSSPTWKFRTFQS